MMHSPYPGLVGRRSRSLLAGAAARARPTVDRARRGRRPTRSCRRTDGHAARRHRLEGRRPAHDLRRHDAPAGALERATGGDWGGAPGTRSSQDDRGRSRARRHDFDGDATSGLLGQRPLGLGGRLRHRQCRTATRSCRLDAASAGARVEPTRLRTGRRCPARPDAGTARRRARPCGRGDLRLGADAITSARRRPRGRDRAPTAARSPPTGADGADAR